MVKFRSPRAQSVPIKKVPDFLGDSSTRKGLASSPERRRGVRLNSQVPIAIEWQGEGEARRWEAQTRIVGPYGCLVVLPQNLDIDQAVQVTNLVSNQSNAGLIVWRGKERPEGWELGIELIRPEMDFWGLDL